VLLRFYHPDILDKQIKENDYRKRMRSSGLVADPARLVLSPVCAFVALVRPDGVAL
jgi:hypothetical protein